MAPLERPRTCPIELPLMFVPQEYIEPLLSASKPHPELSVTVSTDVGLPLASRAPNHAWPPWETAMPALAVFFVTLELVSVREAVEETDTPPRPANPLIVPPLNIAK